MTRHYRNTVLIAHNAKGFDNYPVLNALIDRHGVRPDKILYNGSKIMYMHVAHGLNLTFIDSLNFIGMKLSDIPRCFGLNELQKGYFPHLFNSRKNWQYVGNTPAPQFYSTDYMSKDDQNKFAEWYRSRQSEVFDFQKEMYAYCVSDTDILCRGCMKFRQIMMEVTSTVNHKGEKLEGIDPFDYVTIASACQGIFRRLFMKETHVTTVTHISSGVETKCPSKFENGQLLIRLPNKEEEDNWTSKEDATDRYQIGITTFSKSDIALVPSEGYVTDTFSNVSIQWLEWTMEKALRGGGPRLAITHGLNGSEHRVGAYRLDGYDEKTHTAYEFLGELWDIYDMREKKKGGGGL